MSKVITASSTVVEIMDFLYYKYPEKEFVIIDKDEMSIEEEEVPAELIAMNFNGMSIVDLFSSECSRFRVDPNEMYGISNEDAKIIQDYNKVSF